MDTPGAGCGAFNYALYTAHSLTASQVYGILLWAWLGGKDYNGGDVKCGRLLTIEELGEVLKGILTSRLTCTHADMP